jgi:hypothetical protein
MDLEGLREPRQPTPPMLTEAQRSKSQDSFLRFKHFPSEMKDPFYSGSLETNQPQAQGKNSHPKLGTAQRYVQSPESLAIRMGKATLSTDEPLSPPPSPADSPGTAPVNEPTQHVQESPTGETRSYQRPQRGEPEACIFVASLSSKRTDRELHRDVIDHFSQWGKVLSAKVSRDSMGRPFSFVQFEVLHFYLRSEFADQDDLRDGE